MARFDLYANPEGPGWLLDLQSDLLDGLNTRVVAPLLARADAPAPARRLNPVFLVAGVEAVMLTQFLAAVPVAILGPRIASLAGEQDAITAAVDMVFQGF